MMTKVACRQQPVIAYDLESPGAKAYIQLAREVLGREAGAKGGQHG